MLSNGAVSFDVRGDLEIIGDDVDQVQADAPAQIEARDGAQFVRSDGDGRVRVPRNAALRVVLCRKLNASNLDGELHIVRAKGDVILRNVHAVIGERIERRFDAERVLGALQIRAVGGDVRLEAISAEAHISTIGGDLTVESMQARLTIGTVGRSADLQRIESDVHIDNIGSMLTAREIGAALHCRNVGAHAMLAEVQGPAHIHNVGGNLTIEGEMGMLAIHNVGGSLDATNAPMAGSFNLNIGGNAALKLDARANAKISLRAGGGVDCVLTPDSDATISTFDGHGRRTLRSDNGAGAVSIHCGGRANVRSAAGSSLQSDAPKPEARRSGWFGAFARQAQPPFMPPPASPPTVMSTEERMAVLRMLADKKITIEQAEHLLTALE